MGHRALGAPEWITRVAVAGALVNLALAVGPRMAFPWPLEWMEGAVLQTVQRVLAGRVLYPDPDPDFVPMLYTPLAYVVMAVPAAVFGASLSVVRLASVLATLVSLWLLSRIARRHAGRRDFAWWATAWFALGFGYAGAFTDLARVDGVWLCLVLVGVERLQAGHPRAGTLWLALSVLAKQQGLLFLMAASVWLVMRLRRAAWSKVLPAWAGLLVAIAGLELSSGGRFSAYTFALPRGHGIEPGLLVSYIGVDVGLYLPVLAILAVLAWRRRLRGLLVLDVLAMAGLVASAVGRAHPGGFDNVRLPGLALLCALAAGELGRRMRTPSPAARHRLLFCALLQALWLWQAPAVHIPSAPTREAFERLAAALCRCAGDGEAVALDYGPPLGDPFMHTMALSDLHLDGSGRMRARADAALLARLSSAGRPAAVALGATFGALTEALQRNYVLCRQLPAPRMTTGFQPPDLRIYRRRR